MPTDLDSYPTHFLKCRTFGHSWEEFVPVGKRTPQAGFLFSLLCTSCGSERFDSIGVQGRLISRQYVKHPDYALGFPLTRAEAREEYQNRKRKTVRRGSLLKSV